MAVGAAAGAGFGSAHSFDGALAADKQNENGGGRFMDGFKVQSGLYI
jgi:hypothetical protein